MSKTTTWNQIWGDIIIGELNREEADRSISSNYVYSQVYALGNVWDIESSFIYTHFTAHLDKLGTFFQI